MIYILAFIFSIVMLYIADVKNAKLKGRIIYHIIVSLLIPCLLAAMRSESVGIDVTWYVTPNLERAINSTSLFSFIMSETTEPLYTILVYMCSKASNDVFILLFIIQLLTIVPVYIVLYKNSNIIPMWMGGTVYFFLIYNYSFSLMRQCIAGAFVLLATQLYVENKTKSGFIISVIAVLFHFSSIVCVLFLFVFFNFKIIKRSKKGQLFFAFLIALVILNSKRIIGIMTAYGFINSKYLLRINLYVNSGSIFKLSYAILFGILSLYFVIRNRNDQMKNCFHILAIISPIILIVTSVISEYFGRLNYYFYFIYIVSVPMVWKKFKGAHSYDRLIINAIYISIFAFFWSVIFWKNNSFETLPYLFR